MKKILVTGLLFCSFLSCKSQITECGQNLKDWKAYEKAIQIKFVGIDSTIFKGKNYYQTADSLFWNQNGTYHRYDFKSLKTGEIFRVVFKREESYIIDSIYTEELYRFLR